MMGILDHLFERRDANLSLTDAKQWQELGLLSSSTSGISVTPSKAMQLSAVYACVRILAETVASLPLLVYERLERGKRRATEHQLYELLKDRPNEAMTSFEYREALQGHLALWGNAYSSIVYDGAGQVTELWPLRPDCVLQIVEKDGRRQYQYRLPTGEIKWLDGEYIWHLRGLGSDGRIGYSPIRLMRNALGLGLAAEEFGSRFFANDASAGIVLMSSKTLSDDAQKRLRSSWNEMHEGLEKKHRLAVLEEGMTLEKITIPPNDAQFLETRKFQMQEIARMYRIPPHMLADLDRATFANIEHQSIEFIVQTMRPWFVRWEQSIQQRLFLAKDRKRYFAEFLVDGLLRGDTLTRYQSYGVARQWGWLSANDIRELENQNPIEGGEAYLVPLNMVPAEQVGSMRGLQLLARALRTEEPGAVSTETLALPAPGRARLTPAEERSLRSRLRTIRSHRRLIAEAYRRIIRREISDITRAAEKMLKNRSRQDFDRWLDGFFEKNRGWTQAQLEPVFAAISEAVVDQAREEMAAGDVEVDGVDTFVADYAQRATARQIFNSQSQIRNLLDKAAAEETDALEALKERFDEWEEKRPDRAAGVETFQVGNAAALFTYAAVGAGGVEWVSSEGGCGFCSGLDGKTVGIDEPFLQADVLWAPDGAGGEMYPASDIRYGPLHSGCECLIKGLPRRS